MSKRKQDITVLFVAGEGRSGSTLLGRTLGQVPGAIMCGEIVSLWNAKWRRRAGFRNLCECSTPPQTCDFWETVLKDSGLDEATLGEINTRTQPVFRNSSIAALKEIIFPGSIRVDEQPEAMFVKLYEVLSEHTGAVLIVDTSKNPAMAFWLSHLKGIDLRVVHLIRDSRGVAFSWTKKVALPDAGGRPVTMRRFRPLKSVLRWDLTNIVIPQLRKRGCPVLRVRYEDLIERPRHCVERILQFSGIDAQGEELSFLRDDAVYLRPGHSLAGNPNRRQSGWISFRKDNAWRSRMPVRYRIGATILSLPLLMCHGYLAKQR